MAKSASKRRGKRGPGSARTPKKRAPKRTRRKQAATRSRPRARAATRRTARTKDARRAKKKRTALAPARSQKRAVPRGATAPGPPRAPAVERERRSLSEEELASTPPSTAAEPAPGPAVTGGDAEAESVSMVSPGDEALGKAGDQDRTDDLAGTPGVESQDSEPEE